MYSALFFFFFCFKKKKIPSAVIKKSEQASDHGGFLQRSFYFGCFKRNACRLNTGPCTVSGEEKLQNTGKVIKQGETGEREWVCDGNVSGEARVGLPVLSPSLCGDQDYAGPVHVSWETLGEKYLP